MKIFFVYIKNFIKKILPIQLEKAIKRFKTPIDKLNSDGSIKIHLGCGDLDIDGFINIDLINRPHIHFIKDVKNLAFLKSEFADLIYASHILEHVSHVEIEKTLKEWHRVLKKGGVLMISVPDFDKIYDMYKAENKNIKKIMYLLYGGQECNTNFHKIIFTSDYLSQLLSITGFKEIKLENNIENKFVIQDWSTRRIDGKYDISLNIQAIK